LQSQAKQKNSFVHANLHVGRLTMDLKSSADLSGSERIEADLEKKLSTEQLNSSSVSTMSDCKLLGTRQQIVDQTGKNNGKYLQINENGWIEQKTELKVICPTDEQIERFLRNKETNVINKRTSQLID